MMRLREKSDELAVLSPTGVEANTYTPLLVVIRAGS